MRLMGLTLGINHRAIIVKILIRRSSAFPQHQYEWSRQPAGRSHSLLVSEIANYLVGESLFMRHIPVRRDGRVRDLCCYKRKITKYTTAYDFPFGTLVPISFETGGYAHLDTMAFFKRYIKYGMSDGTATEPVWTSSREPSMRDAYTSFVPPSPSPSRALLPIRSFTGRTRSR